jgi:hypothetical protein
MDTKLDIMFQYFLELRWNLSVVHPTVLSAVIFGSAATQHCDGFHKVIVNTKEHLELMKVSVMFLLVLTKAYL